MKTAIVNSSHLSHFRIWNAGFYTNTKESTRNAVIKLKDHSVNTQLTKLQEKVQTMTGYKQAVIKTKKDMGFSNFISTTASLPYEPRTNLLILKTAVEHLKEYQSQKLTEIKEQLIIIQSEQKTLEEK